jgi:hypothetical protein
VRCFFGLFIPFLLDKMYLEVFRIWPVVYQGRARFCSFGVALGECDKHASAHNAFFLLHARPKEKLKCVLQWMFIKNFLKIVLFLSQDLYKVAFSYRAF